MENDDDGPRHNVRALHGPSRGVLGPPLVGTGRAPDLNREAYERAVKAEVAHAVEQLARELLVYGGRSTRAAFAEAEAFLAEARQRRATPTYEEWVELRQTAASLGGWER